MSVLTWFLLPFMVAVLAWVCRRPLLRAAGRFLVVDDDAGEFDAIILMNGNISTRPYLAAELYRRRPSPVLLARLADTEEVRMGVIPNVSDATVNLLERLGVARGDIHLLGTEGWVAGTWSEALLHRDFLLEQDLTRIIVVTDAFHTRRARWVFRRLAGDWLSVRCAATPFTRELAGSWWASEYGVVQVVVEYLKFLHYRRRHRDFPTRRDDLPPAVVARRVARGS